MYKTACRFTMRMRLKKQKAKETRKSVTRKVRRKGGTKQAHRHLPKKHCCICQYHGLNPIVVQEFSICRICSELYFRDKSATQQVLRVAVSSLRQQKSRYVRNAINKAMVNRGENPLPSAKRTHHSKRINRHRSLTTDKKSNDVFDRMRRLPGSGWSRQ